MSAIEIILDYHTCTLTLDGMGFRIPNPFSSNLSPSKNPHRYMIVPIIMYGTA